jgi:hypothetical protein
MSASRDKKTKPRDEWKETWDWAVEVWGGGDSEPSFHRFFREIALHRAEADGWEELGSSDVWHASYDVVKTLKGLGTVKTRDDLQKQVRNYMGVR